MHRSLRWLAITLLVVTTAQAQTTRPNVLMIICDDLKPDLGCFGNKEVLSPNIDRLAAGGVIVKHAYCQEALCAPSRASIMTGLRPDATEIYDLKHPVHATVPSVETLPQHLKAAGYTTISLSKIYHHHEDDPDGWTEPPWHPPNTYLPLIVDKTAKPPAHGFPATECLDVPDNAYPDGKTAEKAVETLARLKADPSHPFFLAVGIIKPHLPFFAPKKYWDQYEPAKLSLADNPQPPENVPPIALHNSVELRNYSDIPAVGPISDVQARHLIHGYRAATSFADAQVGKILDALAANGQADNTIVLLIGDHGWHLGDHGLWCKITDFESAANAPMIWRVPGVSPGTTNGLVEFLDIYPTICDLCGLPKSSTAQGVSIAPLLRNPNDKVNDAAFTQQPRENGKVMGHSVTDGRFRFTRWQWADGSQPDALELYDHANDPEENHNVVAKPERAADVKRLSDRLAETMNHTPKAKIERVAATKPAND